MTHLTALVCHICVLAALATVQGDQVVGSPDPVTPADPWHQMDGNVGTVDQVVGTVVEQHMVGCHLMLINTGRHGPLLTQIIGSLLATVGDGGVRAGGLVVVEAAQVYSQDQAAQDHLLQGLWGENDIACRGLVVVDQQANNDMKEYEKNNTKDNNNTLISWFLEWCNLWLWPDTTVVVVGDLGGQEDPLLQRALRNTLRALYFALHLRQKDSLMDTSQTRRSGKTGWLPGQDVPEGGAAVRRKMSVHRWSLYANNGYPKFELLLPSLLKSVLQHPEELFPNPFKDMMGFKLKATGLKYFPFLAYQKRDPNSDTYIVTPTDSMGTRILNTMASMFNFTWTLQEPEDKQWGVPSGQGRNWTGVVGLMQHHKVDLTPIMMPKVARLEVIQYSRVYTMDPIVIVSLKPPPLPQHLAIIRPFPDSLWQVLLVGLVFWGVLLWLLQKARSVLVSERGLKLSTSLFYTWGFLLENSVDNIPRNLTGRMQVGWWILVCLILSTAYRSSLVAHLTVIERTRPINSYEDLAERPRWSWGSTELARTSAYNDYFVYSGPLIKYLYDRMEILTNVEGLERVLEGRFSFITWTHLCLPVITTRHTDSHGNHPFHLSTSRYVYGAGYSWGFRKGAPFRRLMTLVKQRMIETGIMEYFMKDVVAQNKQEELMKKRLSGQTEEEPEGEKREVPLGLEQLQGAFYLLALGSGLAIIVHFIEYFLFKSYNRKGHNQVVRTQAVQPGGAQTFPDQSETFQAH